MTTAFFTSCNTAYLPGALALLRGVARHHPDVPRYCMVMAGDRAAAERELAGLAEVLIAPRPIRGVPPAMQVCVLKLFAPLLPVDWVVYIDADAILCRPAPELWMPRPGKVVGALTSTACPGTRKRHMSFASIHVPYTLRSRNANSRVNPDRDPLPSQTASSAMFLFSAGIPPH